MIFVTCAAGQEWVLAWVHRAAAPSPHWPKVWTGRAAVCPWHRTSYH